MPTNKGTTKPSARVLTSAESLQQMKEREQKEEKRRSQEENKRKRELKQAGHSKPKQTAKPKRKKPSLEFTAEEQRKFKVRYENGYDLPDERYSQWLQVYHPAELPPKHGSEDNIDIEPYNYDSLFEFNGGLLSEREEQKEEKSRFQEESERKRELKQAGRSKPKQTAKPKNKDYI